jgi:hypothetical protein
VVLGCLAVTVAAAGLVHAVGEPDGSYAGEVVAESVAAVIGYAVAFGLAWWRPSRSATPRPIAERTALVLAVLGALLVPVCFWNPMPATFAVAALVMHRWAAGRAGRSNPVLVRVTRWLCIVVVIAQAVALAVHIAGGL